MKKTLLTILLVIVIIFGYSQGINFQGVARSANGTIIASSNVGLRLSIISKNVDATPEFIETKTVVTNAQGIFSVVVGDATNTAVVGNFKNIVWSDGPKFLKVEMDPAGGSNYLNMGATQLQYVPYSFYSFGVDAANVKGIVPIKAGGTGVTTIEELKSLINTEKVNNTADLDKPISKFMQAALDSKLDTSNTTFKNDIRIRGVYLGMGSSASSSNGGSGNLLFGSNSLINNTSGVFNIAVGVNTLRENTTGFNNVAIGYQNLYSNTIGKLNTTIGNNNLFFNDIGSDNIVIGNNNLYYNTSGSENIAIGFVALENNKSSSENIAIGKHTLRYNEIGAELTSVGSKSLTNNTASTNSAFGFKSLNSNISGYSNTGIGAYSLFSNRFGSRNTAIGDSAFLNSSSFSNSTAIGFNAQVTGNNQVRLGNQDITTVLTSGTIQTTAGFVGDRITINSVSAFNGTSNVFKTLSSTNDITINDILIGRGNGDKDYNLAIGKNALINTTSQENIAIGDYALWKSTSAILNTALGINSLKNTITGGANTSIGWGAMLGNTTGSQNSAFGLLSLSGNTIGIENVAIGWQSITRNTTGINNTAIGSNSMYGNTTGNNNTALGKNALYNSNFNNSTGVGYNAQVTADNQIQLGDENVIDVKTSGTITAAGYKVPGGTSTQYLRADGTVTNSVTSGVPYTGASQAVDLGSYDMKVNGITVGIGSGTPTVTTNTAIGKDALLSNTTGVYNLAIGYQSLSSSTSGSANSALGYFALNSNTTGIFNSAFGSNALQSNTSGNQNTAIGVKSLINNTIGNDNTAIGKWSMYNNLTGERNTAIGLNTLFSNVGNNGSISIGYNAMFYSDDRITGRTTGNTAVGYEALKGSSTAANNTGINNTVVGYQTLTSNTSGSNNTAIGYSAMSTSSTYSNSTALGYNAQVNASNQIQLGDANITDVKTSGAITAAGYKTPNGTSSQFLRADGSVTSSINATTYELKQPTAITSSSSLSIDFSTGNLFQINLGSNITSLNITNAIIGTYILKITQTGTYTITFPNSWKWSGGTMPTVTAVNGKIDIITLIYDGSNFYAAALQNF